MKGKNLDLFVSIFSSNIQSHVSDKPDIQAAVIQKRLP